MARAVVVGAGVAGLGTALSLARQGHEVIVLERDDVPLPSGPSEAFDRWERRGTPQARHSHAFLARLRNLLRDRFGDVLDALREAGATEIRFCDNLPETLLDWSPRPGDDDLVALACRRTTFEWVLRRAVEAEPGVELRCGTQVTGLAVTGTETPTVTGVHHGDAGDVLEAELTVVATGHRSAMATWLDEYGIELPCTEEETGIVYLSRFYRLHEGVERPTSTGPVAGDLDYLKYAVFQGDDRTFSVTLAVTAEDRELRARLRDPAAFDRAAAALEPAAPWVAAERAAAITDVHVMAGLRNRLVHFTDDDGDPLVLGLHAVGDSHTATNPLYGRGCPLAMVQATLLADALAEHPHDPLARSRAYEAACREEVEPWFHTAVAQDRAARQAAEEAAAAVSAPHDVPGSATESVDPNQFVRDLVRHGILPAARTDADVFRAFLRSFNLLDPPDRLMSDPTVASRVLAAYAERHDRAEEAPLGPPRAQMLALLSA